MKPPPFTYHAPRTLDEATALLANYGYDAKILAGGQSLIPTMNFRLAQPAVLIDINGITDLDFVSPTRDGGIRIGATARHAHVEHSALVAEASPLIGETMPLIAHPQIRNRGTFVGSVAHADPASELPAVLRALGGRLLARSARGERWIDADDFFLGIFTTALEPDEILSEIRIPPMPRNAGWSAMEVARRHGDYALVGVVALVTQDGGACTNARLVFFGVGDGPVVAAQTSAALIGQRPTEAVLTQAAELAASADVDPNTDIHATAAYRRHLVRVLARRALAQAFARAGAGDVQ